VIRLTVDLQDEALEDYHNLSYALNYLLGIIDSPVENNPLRDWTIRANHGAGEIIGTWNLEQNPKS